jgi:hypothetical protein
MTEPKYRRPLNAEQIEVLELLYKFRFGSNNLIAQYFGKKDRSFVFKRLKILQEQGYIGKRFDSSYRIRGKPVAYYLLPAGARELQNHRNDTDEINIKAIYKDKTVKEQFIGHCLDIFSIYIRLKVQYGDKLKLFTKSDVAGFDYFPRPLPDAYMRLNTSHGEKQFFLDIFHDDQPFFKAVRRVKQYIEYAGSGEWSTTETDFPAILAVCESPTLQKRLQKRITKSLDEAWDDELVFALATKAGLSAVWQLASEPDELVALEEIS